MTPPLHEPQAHWSTLIEGLQASPQECYAAIEEAIRRREIPDTRTSRVTYKEGGPLSAERIYLRVERKMLAFDICAAPFGKGFFFSWWQGEVEPANFAGCFVLILAWAAVGYIVQAIAGAREASGAPMSFTQFVLIGFLLPLLALWVVGRAVREGQLFSEDAVLAMPLVGAAYNFIFRPPTYYKQDTIAMYRAAVHAAVLEVVDGVMSENGLRALSPEERQPTLRDFLGKKR